MKPFFIGVFIALPAWLMSQKVFLDPSSDSTMVNLFRKAMGTQTGNKFTWDGVKENSTFIIDFNYYINPEKASIAIVETASGEIFENIDRLDPACHCKRTSIVRSLFLNYDEVKKLFRTDINRDTFDRLLPWYLNLEFKELKNKTPALLHSYNVRKISRLTINDRPITLNQRVVDNTWALINPDELRWLYNDLSTVRFRVPGFVPVVIDNPKTKLCDQSIFEVVLKPQRKVFGVDGFRLKETLVTTGGTLILGGLGSYLAYVGARKDYSNHKEHFMANFDSGSFKQSQDDIVRQKTFATLAQVLGSLGIACTITGFRLKRKK